MTPEEKLEFEWMRQTLATLVKSDRFYITKRMQFADGQKIQTGQTNGLVIGASTTDKIGFWGKAPVAMQAGGPGTAGSSYTGTEQQMLNLLYTMARNTGLLQ